jgi:hypothetical protein
MCSWGAVLRAIMPREVKQRECAALFKCTTISSVGGRDRGGTGSSGSRKMERGRQRR